jgi:shikimate dehydrogenase
MVYAPPETALLRAARARGLRVATGLEMLLEQGAASFELWTGLPAPIEVMRAALAAHDAE